MEESLDSWFKREILAHEEALMRYLLRHWPSRHEAPDLRQDIYVRIYEAASKSRPHSAKSFLFSTARNLMTDRIRRQKIVAIDAVGDLEALNVPVGELTPEQRLSVHQELRRLSEAIDTLPPKCRRVMWMRRVDDLPQKEVAARLGLTEKAVEKHVMRGMRLLARALHRPEADEPSDRSGVTDRARGHGKP